MRISRKRSHEEMHERCQALERMGFEILHNDSMVSHACAPGVVFDFSATDEEKFVAKALEVVMAEGKRIGANQIRKDLANLLRLD